MNMYNLTVKFQDGEQTASYYKLSDAKKGLTQVKKNGYKILSYSITKREATSEEKQINKNHKKLIQELNEM